MVVAPGNVPVFKETAIHLPNAAHPRAVAKAIHQAGRQEAALVRIQEAAALQALEAAEVHRVVDHPHAVAAGNILKISILFS